MNRFLVFFQHIDHTKDVCTYYYVQQQTNYTSLFVFNLHLFTFKNHAHRVSSANATVIELKLMPFCCVELETQRLFVYSIYIIQLVWQWPHRSNLSEDTHVSQQKIHPVGFSLVWLMTFIIG